MNCGVTTATNVLVIDRSRLTREALALLLDDTPLRIVEALNTLEECLERSSGLDEIDIALLSLDDMAVDLADTIRQVRVSAPELRIVMLVSSIQPGTLVSCFNAGIDGCLLKDISKEVLLRALNLILVGERIFPSQLIPSLLKGALPPGGADFAAVEVDLSNREMQILSCLVEGNSNKQIADRLHIAETTVKVHVKAILRKIKAQNRTQAAIWATNRGIVGDTVTAG